MDNIHCYFIHSYDTGFRVTSKDINDYMLETKEDENRNILDFDAEDIHKLYVDKFMENLKTCLSNKRAKTSSIRSETNKFVSTLEENKDEDIHTKIPCITKMKSILNIEDMDPENDNCYSFGHRFYYWPWFKNNHHTDTRTPGYTLGDWYIAPKYKNLKHEMLKHTGIRI